MPETMTYEPGTPCWVNLLTPEPDAAKAFYTALFGWRAYTDPDPAAGGLTTLSLDGDAGHSVTALVPHTSGDSVETPAFWTTYISVPDLGAAAKAAGDAGGQVFIGPVEVGEQGRFAMLFDAQGSHIGFWQPKEFQGARVTREPGAYYWSELTTRDVEGAKEFYGTVVGWESDSHPFEDTVYTDWHKPGGPSIAGMIEMNDQWPPDLPPHWMVYFAVDDCDAFAERAIELGGSVPVPPSDLPTGRFAVLMDPQGGYFSVIRPSP